MAFAEDTAVTPIGDGRYVATLSNDWDLVRLPQGGVVVSMGLRAAAAEVNNDDFELRTSTTTFVAPVTSGDLVIETTVLRRGRTATQVMTTVRNAGASAGALTTSVFGTRREGPKFIDVTMPEVAPPSKCRLFGEGAPDGFDVTPLPFWERIESRSALGHASWETWEPVRSDRATWMKLREPSFLLDGSLDPLAVLTMADRMPGSISERVGPGERPWFAPSADLTVHHFEPVRTEYVLLHDHARWADDGWASAETTVWSEDGILVGYATQMMIFTFL